MQNSTCGTLFQNLGAVLSALLISVPFLVISFHVFDAGAGVYAYSSYAYDIVDLRLNALEHGACGEKVPDGDDLLGPYDSGPVCAALRSIVEEAWRARRDMPQSGERKRALFAPSCSWPSSRRGDSSSSTESRENDGADKGIDPTAMAFRRALRDFSVEYSMNSGQMDLEGLLTLVNIADPVENLPVRLRRPSSLPDAIQIAFPNGADIFQRAAMAQVGAAILTGDRQCLTAPFGDVVLPSTRFRLLYSSVPNELPEGSQISSQRVDRNSGFEYAIAALDGAEQDGPVWVTLPDFRLDAGISVDLPYGGHLKGVEQ